VGVDRALIVAAILIALGGAYVLFVRSERTVSPLSTASSTPQEIHITTASVREETDSHLIDVKYPQFGIPTIDSDIKDKVEVALAEFRDYPANPPESVVVKNEFTGTFEDVYVGPNVVSVKLILSQYTGGAHPMTIVSGLNYDRATGRQLLQQNAFEMLGLTAEEISAQVTTELKEKLDDAFFEEGANSNPENFSSFAISKDTVTFIFQAYQVGPYAAGPQEVSFTRTK